MIIENISVCQYHNIKWTGILGQMASYQWEFAIQGKLETKEKIDIIVKQKKSCMWKWNKEKDGWDS